MAKKKFNPDEWKESPAATSGQEQQPQAQPPRRSVSINRDMNATLEEQIAEVTRRIEEAAVDITAGYDNWLTVGFALADALGEGGRDYFHRVSRFYPQYNQQEADKQYTACVKAGRGAVTVKSFFGRAKDCGISVSFPVEKPQQEFPSTDGSFFST